MESMTFYHPSITKLYQRKFNSLNFNLLMSVFGLNQGIKIFRREQLRYLGHKHHFLPSNSCNLILSDEIKLKFSTKHRDFIINTRRTLKAIERAKIKLEEETPINFNKRKTNHSKFYQRFHNNNQHYVLQYYKSTIITLQKAVRGFLSRKSITQVIHNIIATKSLKCIITIQSVYRQYIQLKRVKIGSLLDKIIIIRKNLCKKIIKTFETYQYNLNEKKRLIIDKLIGYRKEKIILIQSHQRTHRLMKLIKAIIAYEKKHYVLTYPFFAKKIQMKLYLNLNSTYVPQPKYQIITPIIAKYKIFTFEFCQLRQMFVLYININELNAGKYRCQLIVDGCETCDGRFPHIECEDGHYYNLIEFNQGKVISIESGTTKMNTDLSDNDSKESGSDKVKKAGVSSDEEDKTTFVALKKDLEANPPRCFYDKKKMPNIHLESLLENEDNFFRSLKK